MKHSSLLVLTISIAFAACTTSVDTTGVKTESTKGPMGNPSGAVIVVEYGDLQCPACGAAYTQTIQPFLKLYGQKVRFEFKQFPLRNLHEFADEAAQASECAADQGKFWEFVDVAYVNQKDLSSAALRTWAAQLKLDGDLFDRCVRSGVKETIVKADAADGEVLGVNATPTFFVNGKKTEGNSLQALSDAVDAVLKTQGTMPL